MRCAKLGMVDNEMCSGALAWQSMSESAMKEMFQA